MSDEKGKKRLVPALRFPEFKQSLGWEQTTLGKIATFGKGKGISKAEISEKGTLPCVRYGELYTRYGETIDEIYSRTDVSPNDLVLSHANDVIIPASGETEADIATASCVLRTGVALGGDINIIRSKSNGVFLSYYLTSARKQAIAKLAQGISVVHLYPSQLKTLHVALPQSHEQKKIAVCLSSLDDLIAAQARKIEALKAHKKGLMQQLFPAEGETVPRLRFPEFLNAPSWKERCVGKLLKKVTRPITMENDEDYSLVTVKRRYGGVEARGILKGSAIKVKSQFSIRTKDFLISKRQIVHCACGVIPERFNKSIVSNEYSVLEATSECDIDFFWYFSQQPKVGDSFLASSRGIVIEKMLFDLDYWLKIKFLFPQLPEQQKIGYFLASIDNVIDAESCKLKALKAQKLGLMQGLFPSMNEAEI